MAIESRWWRVYDVLWWANLAALIAACLWWYPRASWLFVLAALRLLTG